MSAPLRLVFTRLVGSLPDARERADAEGETAERVALARNAFSYELLSMPIGPERLAEVRQMLVDVLDVFEQDADEPRIIAALDAFDSAAPKARGKR